MLDQYSDGHVVSGEFKDLLSSRILQALVDGARVYSVISLELASIQHASRPPSRCYTIPRYCEKEVVSETSASKEPVQKL